MHNILLKKARFYIFATLQSRIGRLFYFNPMGFFRRMSMRVSGMMLGWIILHTGLYAQPDPPPGGPGGGDPPVGGSPIDGGLGVLLILAGLYALLLYYQYWKKKKATTGTH